MAVSKINVNEIVMKIALKVEDLATEQGRIPFLSGDLRKSITSELIKKGVARVGSPLPYARAVHDGRKALIIRPNVQKNPPFGFRTLSKKFRLKDGKIVTKTYSREEYQKFARLKFKIGGTTVFARQVKQKARKGKPFLREAIDELRREGFDFLLKDLARTYSKDLLKGFKKRIVIDLK